jgi:hypothetical protein
MQPHTAQKNANQFLEDQMAETKISVNTGVLLVAFNMGKQIAIDSEDNVWTVDGWFDEDTDELDIDDPNDEDSDWALVEYVTAWAIIGGDKQWTAFRPDDFDKPAEG